MSRLQIFPNFTSGLAWIRGGCVCAQKSQCSAHAWCAFGGRMWNLTNSSEHSVVIYNAHISLMWLCKSYPSLRTLLRAESYKTQQGDLPSLVRTPCSEWTMNSCISKVKPCPACTQSQTYQGRQKENIEKQVFTASKIKSRARTYKMNCTSEKSVSNIIIYVKCKYCTERFHGQRY